MKEEDNIQASSLITLPPLPSLFQEVTLGGLTQGKILEAFILSFNPMLMIFFKYMVPSFEVCKKRGV